MYKFQIHQPSISNW